jgi:hypothetical protein
MILKAKSSLLSGSYFGESAMVEKAKRTDWMPSEGVVIIHGENGGAIAIPLPEMPKLAFEARRYMSGAQSVSAGMKNHGEWRYAYLSQAQTYNVGILPTSSGEKVALILDQGLETEIGFAIEPEHARELGVELAETGGRASNIPTTKN